MTNERVREVMTPAPSTIDAQRSAVEAARLMASEDVGSLPVVEDGRLVGMVTDRDLVLNVLAKDVDPHQTSVATVCTGNPVVITPEDSLDEALQRMARQQIRRLPVVEDDRLVGILAQADVSRAAEPEETGRMVEQISVNDS